MGQRGVSPPRRARLASASLSLPRLLLDTLRLVGGCCVFDDGDEPDRRAHLGREHRHRHRLVISYGDVSHQHVSLRSHAMSIAEAAKSQPGRLAYGTCRRRVLDMSRTCPGNERLVGHDERAAHGGGGEDEKDDRDGAEEHLGAGEAEDACSRPQL